MANSNILLNPTTLKVASNTLPRQTIPTPPLNNNPTVLLLTNKAIRHKATRHNNKAIRRSRTTAVPPPHIPQRHTANKERPTHSPSPHMARTVTVKLPTALWVDHQAQVSTAQARMVKKASAQHWLAAHQAASSHTKSEADYSVVWLVR